MRKLFVLLSVLIALLAAPASQAEALPRSWRNTTIVTQHGVTYRVRKSDKVAVVVKTKGKHVRIPSTVKHDGRTYRVRNIWSSALKGCKVVYIKANLEGCDCARVWHIKVYVAHRSMLRWLRDTGADVERL